MRLTTRLYGIWQSVSTLLKEVNTIKRLASQLAYLAFFYALGKAFEVSLSDEDIKNHDLDGDREFMAPPSKKVHVTTVQTNETQVQVIECKLIGL